MKYNTLKNYNQYESEYHIFKKIVTTNNNMVTRDKID